jgi:dephospho-CoA kinase
MVMRVAITGGIACGKSLFSRELCRLGTDILDTDDVTHDLEAPGGVAVSAVRLLFGDGVIRADGGVDREALASVVFNDAAARERLNGAVHPLVKDVVARWLAQPGLRPKAVVVPLLFEAGWDGDWDVVICLKSSEAVQVQRLVRSRGLTEEQARRRISAQMPVAEKALRSHIVVNNDADAEALAQEAVRVHRFLMERFE